MKHLMDNTKHDKLINQLPTKYLELLENAYDKAIDIFKDNLLNITIGGSAGKNNIHEGWSDIDLYFILKEYNVKDIAIYNDIFNNAEDIHLGTTFYSLKEIEKQMIDTRTKIMVYEKFKYQMNPTIYGEEYYIPVTYETIRQNDVAKLPSILHDFRREISDLKNGRSELKRKQIKKLLILLKCLLNYHNIFSFGYEEVLIKYSKLCTDFNFDGIKGFKIIKIIDDYDNLHKYKNEIIEFSEDIFEFIYKYC